MMLDERNSTLVHKAAMNGHVNVLSFLIKDRGLPISVLQIPDDKFTTPAMLAIQVWLLFALYLPFYHQGWG